MFILVVVVVVASDASKTRLCLRVVKFYRNEILLDISVIYCQSRRPREAAWSYYAPFRVIFVSVRDKSRKCKSFSDEVGKDVYLHADLFVLIMGAILYF